MSDTSIRNFCTLSCVMAFQVMTFSYSRILLYTVSSKGRLFARRHHFPIIGSTVTLKIYSCNLTSVEVQLDGSLWAIGVDWTWEGKKYRCSGYLVLDLVRLLTNDLLNSQLFKKMYERAERAVLYLLFSPFWWLMQLCYLLILQMNTPHILFKKKGMD